MGEFDVEKLKRLFHYVAWKAGRRDWFGATKLYKVLWFADARQYVLTGRSMTGEVYVREKHGPIPRHAMQVRAQLEKAKAIRVTKEGKLTRIVALTKPDMTFHFTPEELKVVDYWIDHIDGDHTAGSISEESHDFAWQIAKTGEELPLNAIFANRIREPTDKEMEKFRQRAKTLGLL
jgi:hypothetical protein